jgi:hypothetical protein
MDEEFLEESHKQIPNLELTQLVYQCESAPEGPRKQELIQRIIAAVEEDQMLPYYEHLCVKYSWEPDAELVQRLRCAHLREHPCTSVVFTRVR